jgi:osmotically inducible protein OsmC
MAIRNASAVWEGNLAAGKGSMKLGSGAYEGPFTFASRFENGKGTNPEELLGAAHAGCFSMALSHGLSEAGFVPTKVSTTAKVHLDKVATGFKITLIELHCEASVPGIDEVKFQQIAESTKTGCPVSQALAAVEIKLNARLLK